MSSAVSPHKATYEGCFPLCREHLWPCAEKRDVSIRGPLARGLDAVLAQVSRRRDATPVQVRRVTLPALMHLAQTLSRLGVPETTTRTR
jgi:hypothetical protein